MQALNYQDPQLQQHFAQLAVAATSSDAAARSAAEAQVQEFQDRVDAQTGFCPLLIGVIAQGTSAALFCSIVLKNTVKKCWNAQTAEHCIQEADKQIVRDSVIGVMLMSEGAVQRNLAETITLVADVDFPTAWPTALNGIIETLQTEASGVARQSAALSTAHSILVKYREVGDFTEEFIAEMRTIYAMLLTPLLQSIDRMLKVCETDQTPAATVACQGLVSAIETLTDITALDLTDDFIYKLESIVQLLLRCLSLRNPSLEGSARRDGGPLIALKTVATSCVSHFLIQYDEDFEKYAGSFLQVIWMVVADPANAVAAMDDLVIRGLELLASACAGTTRASFDDAALLDDLVKRAIVPNLTLQEEDVEMYQLDPDAYIQRDIEGSDLHTRRRAAGDLVRALVKAVPEKARPLLSAEASRLLGTPGGSPSSPASPASMSSAGAVDWRVKDAGIFLTSSLALEGQHVDVQRGVLQSQLSNLVPFDAFLTGTILPELLSNEPGSSPIIKADCIRVVATFRDHISPTYFPGILQALPAWVALEDPVLSTYAAHAVDRLLVAQQNRQPVVTEEVFAPHAGPILGALCGKLRTSAEPNAFVAQSLMRIMIRVPGTTEPFIQDIVVSVNEALSEAAKNPSNPLFSHCLFEVLSKCIARFPQYGPSIEHVVWACLSAILANEVLEYTPYALQILSQLLGTHTAAAAASGSGGADGQAAGAAAAPPAHYHPLLPPLLEPGIYAQRGNIPAVVCLLTRFIASYPAYVDSQGFTEKALSVFKMLVQLKTYDHEGMNVATAVMLHCPAEVVGRYLTGMLQVLLQRLQAGRTPKFVRMFVIFLSMTVCVRGPADLVTRMNGIQAGLFFMVLDKVWLANMQKVTGQLERKVCVVALARLLTESADLQQNPPAWAQSVYNCLRMIHDKEEADDHTSFAPQTATIADLAKKQQQQTMGGSGGAASVDMGTGFTNVFCPLEAAVQKPVDVCASVADADQYFRQQMKQLLNGPNSGALLQALQSTLQPAQMALLH